MRNGQVVIMDEDEAFEMFGQMIKEAQDKKEDECKKKNARTLRSLGIINRKGEGTIEYSEGGLHSRINFHIHPSYFRGYGNASGHFSTLLEINMIDDDWQFYSHATEDEIRKAIKRWVNYKKATSKKGFFKGLIEAIFGKPEEN